MKKLIAMMIGMGLVLGVTSFAQGTDDTKTAKKGKKSSKKKGSTKKEETKEVK